MQSPEEYLSKDWWAEGDTPVRKHNTRVTYLVDGRTAMLTMCLHFLKARKYIYLAGWGMTPLLELVRGKDQRAGPDGSPEQEALLAELRGAHLSEADIEFWCTHDLSVQAVLGYAVSKGVEVKVLLWDCLPLPFSSFYHPKEAREQLEQVNVTCILDDSARGIMHHLAESLHQKISVVDGTHAFVGGVDLMIELKGDFDRWDMPSHPFASPYRRTKEGTSPHPWHDAHTLIEGSTAGDVEYNFRQRWNDVVLHHHWDDNLLIPEHLLAPAIETQSIVQVARTIPEHTYRFEPMIVRGIAQFYAKAFSNAQRFIYLENQYFWLHTFIGIDVPFISTDSPEMEDNTRKLGEALNRGATMAIVLPDHPNPGRAFTDAGLMRLRAEAPEAVTEGRLQAFCLGTSTREEDGEHYRPIYVHAKVGIIDDVWATAGSGNLNNRGMRDDTEMNVATLDAGLARGLRLMLWAEHLGLVGDDDLFALARYLGHQNQRPAMAARAEHVWHYLQETLSDAQVGLRMMSERAWDNLNRYKHKQPLIGHLLPYLTVEEAKLQGLNVREDHGWLEEG
ncbi:MAG: phospholipase D-like domain-containing protein [Ktedonobacteraceae bacterium]